MEITLSEKKVLKALTEAGGRRITIDELSKNSGVSVSKIYSFLQKPDFKGLFLGVLTNALVADVPPILNKFVEKAKAGEFKHGKLILEIAGAYTEKQEIKAEVKTTESPFKDEDDYQKFVEATFASYLKKQKEG